MDTDAWVEGKVGSALTFDGLTNWVDLGALGDPSAGTIQFWFKKDNLAMLKRATLKSYFLK